MKKQIQIASFCAATFLVTLTAYGQQDPEEWIYSNGCYPTATTWFLGGNSISIPAAYNPSLAVPGSVPGAQIGTCNQVPFILMADNKNTIFIDPRPQTAATAVRVGIGAPLPTCKLEVLDDQMNAEVVCFANQPNFSSAFWTKNASTESYGLLDDKNGIGHIVSDRSSVKNLINFNWNNTVSTPYPQVWIGNKKPNGTYADFSFGVEGKIVSQSVYVEVSNWADYVFENEYKLMDLKNLKAYIQNNHHLPNVPTKADVSENGVNLGEMNKILLEKVEELTLHVIAQQEALTKLEAKISKYESNKNIGK